MNMMSIAKRYIPITIAVLAIAIFAFFLLAYPYHLFHKEQVMLFLYNSEFITGYLEREGWLACLAGDFLTQFFYYIGGGPAILSLTLASFAALTYLSLRQLVGEKIAFVAMLPIVAWETGRSCGLAYPLSATLALIGAEGIFLLYNRAKTEYARILVGALALFLCYLCFGYGAWLCLTLMLAVAMREHHQKLVVMLCAGMLILPVTQYPATTWWSKPDLDREYVLSLDIEHYFGNGEKMAQLLRTDRHMHLATYYRNLHAAEHNPSPNLSAGLSRDFLAYYQPGTSGLILPVDPSATYLSIQCAGELWFFLGDMTMAEHCAMLSMIFSPRHSGSRMIKRLAEINLVNGDNEAALKYLRILDQTLLYKKWATLRTPDNLPATPIGNWLERKRADLPTADFLRTGNDPVASLRHLSQKNPAAYEYLLCYHLLRKDLRSFWEDYRPGYVTSRLFSEAALICLARQGGIQPDDFPKYHILTEAAKDFADYTRLYEAKDTGLKDSYGNTYWFYYHFATIKP